MVEQQLTAVVELKASELANWRAERLGDASVLLGNPVFSALFGRLLDDPRDAEAPAQLRTWLTKVQTHYLYDQVSLFDSQGSERLAVSAGRGPAASVIARRVPEILRAAGVTFEDFYRDEHDGRVYLSLLVPIRDEHSRALGIVVLTIDPETYLYPFLRRWPTLTPTAETLLIRRDGGDALVLNELAFQRHTALTLRVPLAKTNVVAVQAALGQQGVVEGLDCRGVQVLAALRTIPDSPWMLVARIDAAEANAPLRERLWEMLVLVGALLAAAVAGVGVAWRELRVRDLRGRYEADRERAWLHDIVARSLNEVYVFDPETLRFRFVNRGACENLGYTPEELAGLTPLDIKPELTAESFRALLAPLRSPERPKLAFESLHRRKDGSGYPVEVHLQLVDSRRHGGLPRGHRRHHRASARRSPHPAAEPGLRRAERRQPGDRARARAAGAVRRGLPHSGRGGRLPDGLGRPAGREDEHRSARGARRRDRRLPRKAADRSWRRRRPARAGTDRERPARRCARDLQRYRA